MPTGSGGKGGTCGEGWDPAFVWLLRMRHTVGCVPSTFDPVARACMSDFRVVRTEPRTEVAGTFSRSGSRFLHTWVPENCGLCCVFFREQERLAQLTPSSPSAATAGGSGLAIPPPSFMTSAGPQEEAPPPAVVVHVLLEGGGPELAGRMWTALRPGTVSNTCLVCAYSDEVSGQPRAGVAMHAAYAVRGDGVWQRVFLREGAEAGGGDPFGEPLAKRPMMHVLDLVSLNGAPMQQTPPAERRRWLDALQDANAFGECYRLQEAVAAPGCPTAATGARGEVWPLTRKRRVLLGMDPLVPVVLST